MEKKSMLALLACLVLVAIVTFNVDRAQAETRQAAPQRNAQSQRYEVNQTFDGQAFDKDNNIWVYTKEFADLFGMSAQFVEGIEGAEAAAFRIEDTSYQTCGFGGRVENCKKVEQCLIDLYFDESKIPLPWATDKKSEWLPWYSSMRWLRSGDQAWLYEQETPKGVIRNEALKSPLVAFADPISKRQAIFTSNVGSDRGGEDEITGSLVVIGYSRQIYKNLTVVNLRLGCTINQPKTVNIRLDAKKDVYGPPIARFNRLRLPEGFVQRIKEQLKAQSERNRVFSRSLFPPPLGTQGVTPPASNPSVNK